MAEKKQTFEQALTKLEEIAQQIEQGEIGLEESIKQYEQGMKLVTQCKNILDKAEQRVKAIQEKNEQIFTETIDE